MISLHLLRRHFGSALAVLTSVCVLLCWAVIPKAQAQFYDGGGYPPYRAPPQHDGGFFGNLFGGFGPRPFYQPPPYYDEYRRPPRRRQESAAESSRAPAPRKAETTITPATSILVMGDGMADWLAHGLEDAFLDSPEIAVVRKNKVESGLVRYEPNSTSDWSQVARDILAQEKADFVVMMIGLHDRQNFRESEMLSVEADKKEADKNSSGQIDAKRETSPPDGDKKTDQLATSERARVPPKSNPERVIEFRSDEWAKLYAHRIDDLISVLKSKGAPVFLVGLPPIRGTKSTAAAGYLNDLYRARAERAGIVYIDAWDGFVDDAGKYTNYGPDFEGQIRRLRSSDGVFFTKHGARKLAHYVEREIRRYIADHISVALPSAPSTQMPGSGKPATRPLAGPVVPLTAISDKADTLLGALASARTGTRSNAISGDVIATQVLVKGEALSAPQGRADHFMWFDKDASANSPEVKSPANITPDNLAAATSTQQPDGKNENKNTKSLKSGATASVTRKTSPKRTRRQVPRNRPEFTTPLPLPSLFPWLGQ